MGTLPLSLVGWVPFIPAQALSHPSRQATFVLYVSPFASRRRPGPACVGPTPLLLSSRLHRPEYWVCQRHGYHIHPLQKPSSPPNAGFLT